MPPCIDLDFLNTLNNDYKNYPNFIESGTYFGETIFNLEKYFSNLYSIEIKEDFYNIVKNKYNGNKIKFYLGDSSIVLNDILPNINGKSIIFLDGHWSAGNTGRGYKDCPLYEELNNIMLHHKDDAIIIIDDRKSFGKGPNNGGELCNWENINEDEILKIVNSRIVNSYDSSCTINKFDRLIINISKIS
tara:strand:+ start:2365 stop:2931 length:567 start_codon:yes stop_codon:yes gene_type:complete